MSKIWHLVPALLGNSFSRRWCVAVLVSLVTFSNAAVAESLETELNFNGVTLLVSGDTALSSGQIDKISQWLDHLTASMLLVYGEAPHPVLRIQLETFNSGSRAVAFGQIIRGAPPGMRFFVNPNQPLDNFLSDWTPYHEASHLFIPYPGQRDIWISEGLASYYQNVLRYRAGVLGERDTWQKLVSGFTRAQRDTRHYEFTLAALSEVLRERYAYMRVYWTGALYFLEADMALREASGNRQSLDTVLGQFANCCLRKNRRWSGAEILERFDQLAGFEIFIPLYKAYAETTAIPDFAPVLKRAGVPVVGGDVQPLTITPLHDLAGIGEIGTE